jgi:NAD-dependent deacetylase
MTDLHPAPVDAIVEALHDASRIAVLTGAGMSAESGIPTFRGARTGLWAEFDPQRLATPEAFHRDPDLVWGWYQWRTALVAQVSPHAGHHAIAHLERLKPGLAVITQNVDDLHERAGSSDVMHLHGSLLANRCSACGRPHEEVAPGRSTAPTGAAVHGGKPCNDPTAGEPAQRLTPPACAHCSSPVRPGVVWFGESLPIPVWQRATDALEGCDALLVVGTSGIVQPAATLPRLVKSRGRPVIEINPASSEITPLAEIHWRVTAAEGLAEMVDAMVRATRGRTGA